MTKDIKAGAVPANKPTTRREPEASTTAESGDDPRTVHGHVLQKNDRPYGFAIAITGVIAAFISFVLVGAFIFQTRIVHNQLEVSRRALESSTESFQQTIAEMKQQRDAMTAQVDSMITLTSTLEQIFRDQQRARMSFRVKLVEINDVQTGIRVVAPLEIGGTTEARQVRFKNYVAAGVPGQRQYLDSLSLDWSQRESHPLTDVAPTEVGRQFVTSVLSQTRMETVVSREESLYFVGRLEYCDIYGSCRYFMRCAEFAHHPGVIVYCGTRIGSLDEDRSE